MTSVCHEQFFLLLHGIILFTQFTILSFVTVRTPLLFGFKACTRITQSMRRTFKGQPTLKGGSIRKTYDSSVIACKDKMSPVSIQYRAYHITASTSSGMCQQDHHAVWWLLLFALFLLECNQVLIRVRPEHFRYMSVLC